MKSNVIGSLAVVAVLTTGVAACSSSGGSTGSNGNLKGTITVLAASSLTGTFTILGQQFEKAHPGTKITFSFGASSTLATQATQGNGDVFASASLKTMKTVSSAGDALKVSNFASNTMEIATPPGNPAKIASVADLAKSSVKVAVCDPAVPCGSVAQQVFANAKITVKPVSLEEDVKSTLAKIELGEVDAGIVYVTDVNAAGSKVTGIMIPAAENATTLYPISALKGSMNSALAAAFVDYVLSADGQKVLQAAGFAKA